MTIGVVSGWLLVGWIGKDKLAGMIPLGSWGAVYEFIADRQGALSIIATSLFVCRDVE